MRIINRTVPQWDIAPISLCWGHGQGFSHSWSNSIGPWGVAWSFIAVFSRNSCSPTGSYSSAWSYWGDKPYSLSWRSYQ